MKTKITKYIVLTGFLLLATVLKSFSQQQTLKVFGKDLTTITGQVVTLRGINYPIIDDGNFGLDNVAATHHKIDEVAMTGANAIRIPWYTDGAHWRDNPEFGVPGTVAGYLSNGNLSDLIGYCHTKGMIPILEIHNATCSNDWPVFTNVVMAWWQQAAVLDLITTHKEYLIINLANEFGYARWTGDTAAGLTVFRNNYNTAIAGLRNAGVTVPVLIDAPDCGQSSTELLSVAESMVNNDPEHNLIFSAHAYWSGYATTQSAIAEKLDEAVAVNACFIIGEVASTQDGDFCGSISLADIYPVILGEACSRNIGWLAWTYDQDCSAGREMTTNGEYSMLTAYGDDLVNNTVYGLKSIAGCGAIVLNIAAPKSPGDFKLYPNPAQTQVSVTPEEAITKVKIFDLSGRMLKEITFGFGKMDISSLNNGSYLLQFETAERRVFTCKLIKTP